MGSSNRRLFSPVLAAAFALLLLAPSVLAAADLFSPPHPRRSPRGPRLHDLRETGLPGFSSSRSVPADAQIFSPLPGAPNLLAIAYAFEDVVLIARPQGETFEEVAQYPVGLQAGAGNDLPRRLAIEDFDNDGILDIAVLCSGNTEIGTPPSLGILYGLPSGGFAAFQPLPLSTTGGPPGSGPKFSIVLNAGRIDGDARPDLVVGHFDSKQVTVLLNRGARQWAAPDIFSVPTSGNGPCEVLIRDVSRDGAADLVTINRKDAQIWRGKGDGTFFNAVQVSLAGLGTLNLTAAGLGDFNGDGMWDLALVDGGASRIVALAGLNADGASSFTHQVSLTPGGQPISVAIYNANNDARDDAALVYLAGSGGDLLLGEPAGSTALLSVDRSFETSSRPRSVRKIRRSDGSPVLLVANEGDLVDSANQDITLASGTAGTFDLGMLSADPNPDPVSIPEFDYPVGLSWDAAAGALWLVENRQQMLTKVSLGGQRLEDRSLSEAGQPRNIVGVCVDSTGGWWFADREGARAIHRDASGAMDASFSTAASGVTAPSAIAFNASGPYVFVADTYLPLVAVFAPNGTPITTLTLPNGPVRSLVWDGVEQVLWSIPATQTDRVQWLRWPAPMNPPHGPVTSARIIQLKTISQFFDGQSALAVAVDPVARHFWVLLESGTLIQISTDGNMLLNARELSLLRDPGGLALETSSTLLIADSAPLGTVIRTTLDGQPLTSFSFAQNVARPVEIRGIARLGDRIYVLDAGGEILISELDGTFIGKFAQSELKGLDVSGLYGHVASGRLIVGLPGELLELSTPNLTAEPQQEPELTAGGKIEARHPIPLSIVPDAISGSLLGAGYSIYSAETVTLTMLRADFAVTGSVTRTEDFPLAPDGLVIADPGSTGQWHGIVVGPQLLTGATEGVASAAAGAWVLYE